jgi:hypothetical protein
MPCLSCSTKDALKIIKPSSMRILLPKIPNSPLLLYYYNISSHIPNHIPITTTSDTPIPYNPHHNNLFIHLYQHFHSHHPSSYYTYSKIYPSLLHNRSIHLLLNSISERIYLNLHICLTVHHPSIVLRFLYHPLQNLTSQAAY